MDGLLPALALLAWLSVLVPGLRLPGAIRGTALTLAYRWCVAVWLTWGAVRATGAAAALPEGIRDVLWYGFAVLLLVPPIAILGARRPIHRAWNWFVLVPLLLVFTWPVSTAFAAGGHSAAFSLEGPVVVGYCLVLLMGTGNYLGTSLTIAAMLWVLAALQLILPFLPAMPWQFPVAATRGDWAAILLAGASWTAWPLALRASRRAAAGRPGIDRVWVDFRNAFGIVWSRPIQDRFGGLPGPAEAHVRLGPDGLDAGSGKSASNLPPETLAACESSLRWLLQKFVDPAWIDARMPPGPESPRAAATAPADPAVSHHPGAREPAGS